MSSCMYPNGRKHFALGDIHWKQTGGSTIKVTLIDAADYTYNASHEYMNDSTVPSAARVATATATINGDSPADGVCDLNDTTFTSVTGDQSEALIVWLDGGGGGTGSNTTDFLIAYLDNTAGANGGAVTGLPVTPNGGNIVVQWDNTAGLLVLKL